MLYVYTIQHRYHPREEHIRYFEAAVRCHSQISSKAKNESLAQRYSVVLEELRLEAITDLQRLGENHGSHASQTESGSHSNHDSRAPAPGTISGCENGRIAARRSIDGADVEYVESSPSVTMDPLTGWGQFDSLVRHYRVSQWKPCLLHRLLADWAASTSFLQEMKMSSGKRKWATTPDISSSSRFFFSFVLQDLSNRSVICSFS